jgi:LmbE family N-acetylglucosaminyl deacetylase
MTKLVELKGPEIVLRRPHFRLAGDELFFLISRRPYVKLSANELAVWRTLVGDITVDTLRNRFAAEGDPVIRRFTELNICEIIATNYPSNRRRVLVFEPHSDDAVLSVGATMWLRRHECKFILVTIGSRSNFTSYYNLDREYFNVDQVSSLRNAEGVLFARLLGGEHRALGQSEATLRYHDGDWSLDWYRQHKFSVSAFIAHRSSEAELKAWTQVIRASLSAERAEEVWLPLGGPHTDHQLTRDAFLTLLQDDPTLFKNYEVRLYQDVPYAARFPSFSPTVLDALTRAGAVLEPELVPITPLFAKKLHLMSLYASQFKLDAIRADVEASARVADGDGALAERLWRLKKTPDALSGLSFSSGEPIIRHAIEKLSPWLRKHRDAERIRLLLLVPAGRWADDVKYLLGVFPKARIEAYVAAAAAAEVAEFESPRIHVHRVASGTQAWLRLALRLILLRPIPTLFLAGEKRLLEARLLSSFWIMSETVILPTMDQLVTALRAIRNGAKPTVSRRSSNLTPHVS